MNFTSKKIFIIDVKDPTELTTNFHYNFFVKDESTSDTTISFLNFKKSDQDNNLLLKRYPRYVKLNWKTSNVSKIGSFDLENHINDILSEDFFIGGTFCRLQTKNSQLSTDAYYTIVSGSEKFDEFDFEIFEEKFKTFGIYGKSSTTKFISDINDISFQLFTNSTTTKECLNLSKKIVPNCNYSGLNNAIKNICLNQFQGEFDLDLPYVDIKSNSKLKDVDYTLVGYVIDKYEIVNNSIEEKKQLIVSSGNVHEYIDTNIKYGSTYLYKLKSIYKVLLPATNVETQQKSLLTLLISSNPIVSNVECIEFVQPNPPNDVSFLWDYGKKNNKLNKNGCLMIHWQFPIEQQRDIKYFQVMRRPSLEQPFELVKMFDFNDAIIKSKLINEEYDQKLIEQTLQTYWYDEDFTKNSHYIYTICSIDAHGYISHYGPQFELWFDVYKNKLKKSLVSHSGAPRSYPNMFIENDLFVDTMRTTGGSNKNIDLYLDPEYYSISYDDGRLEKVLLTNQQNASYRLQIINLDNQQDHVLSINVDDLFKITD